MGGAKSRRKRPRRRFDHCLSVIYLGHGNGASQRIDCRGLDAQAAAQGLTIETYLERVLLATPLRSSQRISVEELDRLIDQESQVGPSPFGSFSRAELYYDHD